MNKLFLNTPNVRAIFSGDKLLAVKLLLKEQSCPGHVSEALKAGIKTNTGDSH
jgi:hypothetical protein